MDNIVYLIFRRMRRPLMTLLVVYSISILGLVLIPGLDDQGNRWHMGFFHAFYFVSYMATTIGFGEIPHTFTDAQRMWVLVTLYAGVISWLYAMGTILSLVQDKTFQRALAENKFAKNIRSLREPFYIVCGYGETGSGLVKALTEIGQHVVVIEINESRSLLPDVSNLREFVPSLHGDARKPLHLQEAGLQNPLCKAVVAVTNKNEANLKIAITSKLLHPDIKVICRADSHDIEKNMASFGTDYIVDPYDAFARSVETAFLAPCLYLLQSWFSSGLGNRLAEPIYPPRKGHWIVCGFGRFGKAVYKRLIKEGLDVVVVEMQPNKTGTPNTRLVKGRGTEADTLYQAEISTACGIVAGTDDDTNNLSIVVTAREINNQIFTIARQNHLDNSPLFDALDAEIVMHPSNIIADRINVLLGTPMLYKFISLASYEKNEWACELASRISGIVGSRNPKLEEICICDEQSPAIMSVLKQGEKVTIGNIMRDPWKRKHTLRYIILMLERESGSILLPDNETELMDGDHMLVCLPSNGLSRLFWSLKHDNSLSYVRTGRVTRHGWLWQKLKSK
ncbi:MAG: potassium channel family protein [Gammaproteobacteria bacterium]|nr:potassium channel family protein [Gammaproteobacteria bacterium]